MPERDILKLHALGCFAFISGLILLVMTGLSILLLGFAGGSQNLDSFVRGALAIALSIVMAAVLSSFGLRFMRVKLQSLNRHELRLDWTAWLLAMIICGGISLPLSQPLTILAGLTAASLLLIRPAVLRLAYRF